MERVHHDAVAQRHALDNVDGMGRRVVSSTVGAWATGDGALAVDLVERAVQRPVSRQIAINGTARSIGADGRVVASRTGSCAVPDRLLLPAIVVRLDVRRAAGPARRRARRAERRGPRSSPPPVELGADCRDRDWQGADRAMVAWMYRSPTV